MSLKDSARVGRDLYWTRRGIDEFGGGLLGVLLMTITEKCEQFAIRDPSRRSRSGFLNRILSIFWCKHHSERAGTTEPSRN